MKWSPILPLFPLNPNRAYFYSRDPFFDLYETMSQTKQNTHATKVVDF